LAHTLRGAGLAIVAGGIVTTLLGIASGARPARVRFVPSPACRAPRSPSPAASFETRLPRRATTGPSPAYSSFNLMVDQLEERIDREARFTSDVSHELRSPLTTISPPRLLEAHRQELRPRPARH